MFSSGILYFEVSSIPSDLVNLQDVLLAEALPRDWLFPADQKSEMSDLHRVEDFIRVEFFKRLHQYLPYLLKQVC